MAQRLIFGDDNLFGGIAVLGVEAFAFAGGGIDAVVGGAFSPFEQAISVLHVDDVFEDVSEPKTETVAQVVAELTWACPEFSSAQKLVPVLVPVRALDPPKTLTQKCLELEARVGIEPTHKAFAEPCLTTWLPRRSIALSCDTLSQISSKTSTGKNSFSQKTFPPVRVRGHSHSSGPIDASWLAFASVENDGPPS